MVGVGFSESLTAGSAKNAELSLRFSTDIDALSVNIDLARLFRLVR
jgi:hypothetical protein